MCGRVRTAPGSPTAPVQSPPTENQFIVSWIWDFTLNGGFKKWPKHLKKNDCEISLPEMSAENYRGLLAVPASHTAPLPTLIWWGEAGSR